MSLEYLTLSTEEAAARYRHEQLMAKLEKRKAATEDDLGLKYGKISNDHPFFTRLGLGLGTLGLSYIGYKLAGGKDYGNFLRRIGRRYRY